MLVETLTPVLIVPEIEPCLAFWTERLGWKAVAEVKHHDKLGFVLLMRDGVQLMYQSRASLAEDMPELEPRDAMTSVLIYVNVADLDAIEAALAGIDLTIPRRTTFYGATEIGVREPGGNVVVFAKRQPA
jgi:uncharacterized glyoxalase superfamily protein PhnB